MSSLQLTVHGPESQTAHPFRKGILQYMIQLAVMSRVKLIELRDR